MGGICRAGACPRYHPAGPVGPASWPSLYLGPAFQSKRRANPQNLRINDIFSKVSQNDEVSPENVNKAYHSPYSQIGLRKSPLDFLRFPFSPAFSGKELMGLFWPRGIVYCQNDEVSLDVHTMLHAKWSSDTPTVMTQQAASVMTAPHLTQRGILNEQ